MSSRRLRFTLAANTISQIIGKIITSGVSVLVTILIARRFGVDGFGDFTKITTFVAFFYLLADFGFNAVTLRQVNEGHPRSWSVLFSLRLLWSTLLVFLCLAILVFLPSGAGQGYTSLVRLGIIILVPSIVFQALLTTANAVFQKHLRYDLSSLALFLGGIVTIGGIFIASATPLSGAGIVGVVFVIGLGSFVSAVSAIIIARKLESDLGFFFDAKNYSLLFVTALPLGITLLLNLVYFRIDSVVMALSRTTGEVGIYGLAYKVFEFPLVIPTFFMNALYPMLLGQANNQIGQKTLLKKSAIGLGILSIIVALVGWWVAPLVTWVKPEFTASVVPLRILIAGLPFFYLSSLTMWTMIARGQQKMLLVIYGLGMIVNTGLNIWLTPLFGYLAAAWITVGSEAFVLLISTSVLWAKREFIKGEVI